MERCQWRHRQELAELKHNTDLMVMEIRASMEAEKQRALLDFKHKHEIEKEQAVQETKRKQWCAFCLKEAQLYCCWNTAYCSYNCQQSHWLPHMNSCLNKQHQDNNNPDILPRGVVPRPAYNLSPGQRARQQLMPPPANPPHYHQAHRPNQLYSSPRFPPRNSFHTHSMETHFPGGQL
uniref:MYND-type domain-containing protein n=1 Tax=Graphocephala atropunctata TaxID=36148 RepID=A0A1B6MQD8_9HEMI